MKRKFLTLIAALGILAGLAACSHHPGPEKRADWMVSRLSGKLDLNDAQKAKLNAVKDAILEARKEHQDERKQNIDELKKLVSSEKLEASRVKSLMDQKDKMFDQSFDKVFPKLADFHASLTPEQKKKAVDMIEKFTENWDE